MSMSREKRFNNRPSGVRSKNSIVPAATARRIARCILLPPRRIALYNTIKRNGYTELPRSTSSRYTVR
ncbi:hypothetical protein JKF63_04784 [Porcisia hertigi]|uniref:Uncharacterized protein n=1 Tax=Porcisia hertigi TaxID=2761500 RepID=A0A836LBR8_9TRYP|nr:hypothetical protein JKF63_04784 [Porcisia hertigi]